MKTTSHHATVSQTTLRSLIRPALTILSGLSLSLSVPALVAQTTHTWDGGGADDNLNTANNWNDDVVPVANDTLTWNGSEAGAITALVTGDIFGNSSSGLAGITVTSAQTSALTLSSNSNNTRNLRMAAAGSFTIEAGAGAVTIGGGAFNMGFSIAGGGTSNFTFTNNSTNGATIGSVVTISRGGSSGTRGLVFNGTGNWNVGATIGATLVTLNKSGSGALTYSGTTAATALASGVNVTGGKLIVTGTLSNASSAVSVSSGATLAGTGTINGATLLAGGSFLSAGMDDSTLGTLTFASTLGATSGVTVSLNLNSMNATHDQIVANGVTLGNATLSLTDLGGTVLANGTSFTLVNNTSGGSIGGTFLGLDDGATITVGANSYVLSYFGGTGNDITLTATAIPEPATAALLMGGVLVLLVTGRRVRKNAV